VLLIADVWVQGKTMPKKTETSADRKKGVNDLKGKIKDLESEAQRCVPFFTVFCVLNFGCIAGTKSRYSSWRWTERILDR
jgi:hypothetical protein